MRLKEGQRAPRGSRTGPSTARLWDSGNEQWRSVLRLGACESISSRGNQGKWLSTGRRGGSLLLAKLDDQGYSPGWMLKGGGGQTT